MKELEKKAYRSTFQDGFWDIFMGMIIFGFGFILIQDIFLFFGELGLLIILSIWNGLSVVILHFGKKFVTIPRLGYVEFGPKRKKKRLGIIIFLSINVVFGFLFFLISFIGMIEVSDSNILFTSLLMGFIFFTLPFSILAFLLDFTRLYLYGFICGFGFFNTEHIYPFLGSPLDAIIAFIVPGAIIIMIGIVYLIKFIKRYPKPNTENSN